MLAARRMDRRDPYVDKFFGEIEPSSEDTLKVAPILAQIKDEFRKDMRTIQHRTGTATNSFQGIEKDPEIVYGTTGMRLLMADAGEIDKALDDFDVIRKIHLGQEAVNLRQDIHGLKDRFGLDKETYEKAEQLIKAHAEVARKYSAFAHFGYCEARQNGKDFPEALTTATMNLANYTEETQTIARQKGILAAQIQDMEKKALQRTLRHEIIQPPPKVKKPETESKANKKRIKSLLSRLIR